MLNRKSLLLFVTVFFIGCGTADESPSKTQTEQGEPTEVIITLKGEGEDFLKALNEARAEVRDCHDGKGSVGPSMPLTWNDALYASSYEHSYDMAMSDTFSHYGSGTEFDTTALNGRASRSYFYERIESNGYGNYTTLGENIAGGQTNIEEVMDAWLKSPGHCSNIMNSDFREVGIAVVTKSESSYGVYWTQNFGSK